MRSLPLHPGRIPNKPKKLHPKYLYEARGRGQAGGSPGGRTHPATLDAAPSRRHTVSEEDQHIVDQQTKAALKQNTYVVPTGTDLAWARRNRRSVITTVAVLLALVILAVVAAAIYHVRSEAASTAFGAAMADYQTPLAAPGQPVPAGVKTYSSVADRAKAANAAFLQVAHQYGLTPDGKNALYFAGLTYIEEGQNASAESTLKDVASGWSRNLANLAKLSLAQLYRQTGRNPQAVDMYNELTSKPSDSVPAGLAQLQLAELYDSEGKPEQARKIYAQLKDRDAKGPAGVIAAGKLNPTAAPANPQLAQ